MRIRAAHGLTTILSLGCFGATTYAQETPEPAGALEQIVVTARKREESVQETPVAVTAVSGAELENRSAMNFKDLAMQTPSLRITQSNNSANSATISMRGLVYTDIRLNADPAVGVYLDGVYLPRSVGINAGNLVDIQSVQVSKGPQGTLFGRNTTGGAIDISTKQPDHEFGGMVKVRAGTYDDYGAAGVVNLPITDTLAARIVADHSEHGGFGTNFYNGDKFGKRDSTSARAAIKWEPTDAISLIVRADYTEADATSLAWNAVLMVPNSGANREVAAATGLSLPAALNYYLGLMSHDPQDGYSDITSREKFNTQGVSATLQAELPLGMTLKSVTAYRDFTRVTHTDFDASPFQIQAYDPYQMHDHQLTQELQLLGTAFDDRLQWITGGFYGDEKGWEGGDQYNNILTTATWPSTTFGRLESETVGVFLQGTYKITDRFSGTAGVRYTEDKRDLTSANRTRTVCTTLGVTIASLGNEPCVRTLPTLKTDATSYVASLDYRFTDDLFGYVKTSKGYRSGGQALTGGSAASPVAATASYRPFQPEFVKDYEIGLKSEWLDHRLRANLAYYHSKYDDIQRTRSATVPGTSTVVSVVENVAAAEIDGVELEVLALPIRSLEVNATAAYIDPKYTDYTVNGVDLRSTPFYMVTKLTYSLSLAHTAELSFGDLRSQVDFQHDDAFTTSGLLGKRPSVDMLNARIGLHLNSSDLDIALYGRNLTDRVYPAYQTDISSAGFVPSIAAPPREGGIEIKKSF